MIVSASAISQVNENRSSSGGGLAAAAAAEARRDVSRDSIRHGLLIDLGRLGTMPGMIETGQEQQQVTHSLLSLQSPMPPQEEASSTTKTGAARSSSAPAVAAAGAADVVLKPEERGLCLIHLLYSCAHAVERGDMEQTNFILEQLSSLASPTGDPMQRVATYFMEALAARVTRHRWPGLYKALLYSTMNPPARSKDDSCELQAARRILFNVCPYSKFAFLTVNQTILDAMQGEKVVHVVDLQFTGSSSNHLVQWQALLQAFNSRPEGPPHLRITAVNHSKEVVSLMGLKLSETADRLDIPFQFHPVVVSSPGMLHRDMLGVKIGEAVAVSSLLQLHRLLAVDSDQHNKMTKHTAAPKRGSSSDRYRSKRSRQEENGGVKQVDVFPAQPERNESQRARPTAADCLLNLLYSLSPKVVVMVEHESSHNAESLPERFANALHYYSAVFDSLDSSLPHDSTERTSLEKVIFGQQIHNVVACEGLERVERHESLNSWRERFEQSGFTSAVLSPTTVVQAERLLGLYAPDRYRLQRDDKGALTLCWQDTPMLSLSAWQPS